MYDRTIKIEGSDSERGYEIGKLLKERIGTNYANQTRFYQDTERYEYTNWEETCLKYVPFMEQYTPDVLEEIRGVARGAGLPFQSILAMATAYEKSFGCENVSDKCTAFFVANEAVEGQAVICGQTNDERLDEWLHELDVVIHHINPTTQLEVLLYTHPGVPAYMGMNNNGLAVLWTYIDNGKMQEGVPTNIIIRKLLNCGSIDEAVLFLQKIPHAIPNFFGLIDQKGSIVGVECFPNKVYVEYKDNYMVHTNHNIFATDEQECTCSWSTNERLQQMEKMLEDNYGKINTALAKTFLASHEGQPFSVCVHPNEHKPLGKTLAAMVYDLKKGEMNIAFGNACEMPYHTYSFDIYLPDNGR